MNRTFARLLIVSLLMLSLGCEDEKVVERTTIRGVVLEVIEHTEVEQYFEVSAEVKAKTVSEIAGRVMAAVTEIKVREGDRVEEGDVLIVLDGRDLEQRVVSAREALDAAQRMLEAAEPKRTLMEKTQERYQTLFDERAISEQEMDEIEAKWKLAESEHAVAVASVNGAKAALKEARIQFGYTKIKAPVAGVVTNKMIEEGSMCMPGKPLLNVEDDSAFLAEAHLAEKFIDSVRVGDTVRVVIGASGKEFEGQITAKDPHIDSRSRTFLIKVGIEDRDLKTGQYAKVIIPTGTKRALVVPADVIVKKGQLTGVWAVSGDGVVSYRLLRIGAEHDGNVEVISGLKPGESIVVDGLENVVEGGAIESTTPSLQTPREN